MNDANIKNDKKPKRESRMVKVWDIPTRMFHWSLVAMVFIGLATGYIAPEWWMGLHIWAGYITVTLLVFRLVWGVFGSEYARLETFTFSPVHILTHMKEIITLRPVRHYIGHNPSGAVMIFALLAVLSIITVSGLLVLGGEENQGPMAGAASYAVSEIAAPIHSIFVALLVVMVVLHIGGVILEGKITGENLVRSMITGLKRVPEGTPPLVYRRARPLAAILVTMVFFTIGGALLVAFASMPPSGLARLEPNKRYETDCGDCHLPYHPSLLPAKSWEQILATLDDHFGEDATISADAVNEITAYLVNNASEKWDTEAANRFRNVDPDHPMEITKTRYWIHKHDDISPETFKIKGVGVKSNCGGCHTDYYTGRFDDQKIKIPKAK